MLSIEWIYTQSSTECEKTYPNSFTYFSGLRFVQLRTRFCFASSSSLLLLSLFPVLSEVLLRAYGVTLLSLFFFIKEAVFSWTTLGAAFFVWIAMGQLDLKLEYIAEAHYNPRNIQYCGRLLGERKSLIFVWGSCLYRWKVHCALPVSILYPVPECQFRRLSAH